MNYGQAAYGFMNLCYQEHLITDNTALQPHHFMSISFLTLT